MEDQRLAVHQSIVVVDVEGFGDQRRTNAHQLAVRDGLYWTLREAFGQAGLCWDDCRHEDRGDGVFVLVPAVVPKGLLAGSLPPALVTALRAHNAAHPGAEQIRLRMALHAGEVWYDEHGVTAASVNLAFRLLEAGPLKTALAASPGVLAIIASSWFFDEVVRHSSAASAYHQVEVAVKETTTVGWVCLPDQVDPAGQVMPERTPRVAGALGVQPAVALRTLPRDTAAFTGRTRELDRLMAAVCRPVAAGGVFGIHAVDGMAGIGKTTFAVHAAHRLAARFPDGQIFLRLHAHTARQRPVDPAEALAALLLTIGIAPQQIPPGLDEREASWRSHLAGKKMLLVLDDAASSDQVRPLIPGTADCAVLITSRRRLTALAEAAPISLGTLQPGEAADLFVQLAARPGLQSGDQAVAEITRLCGYLPLAVRIVAAGLRHHPAWTVTDLAGELGSARDGRLEAMQAEDVSVAAAFDLSYKDLTPDQQHLFRRLGLHPGTEIDAYAAAALDDTSLSSTRQRLRELHDQNLIGEPGRGRYRLHDLLREHARGLAAGDDAADNQAAIGRLLDYYLHAAVTASLHTAWYSSIDASPPSGHRPAWAPQLRTQQEAADWLRTERANLHACVDYAAAHGRYVHAVRIPLAMSGFLHTQGHWNEAVTLGQTARAAARKSGDQHGHVRVLTQLGIAHEMSGNYPAATASLTQALQLSSDLGDPQRHACALTELATVQWLTGQYPAATVSVTRALQLFADLADQPGQAWALHQLGTVQRRTWNYSAAATSLTQALQLSRDLGDQRSQAWVLDELGVIHQLTGDNPAATASLIQALQLSRELGDRQCQASALNHLGVVQLSTGDYPAARASLTQALQLYRDLGDPAGHAGALINLGELLSLSSAHSEARGYFTQARSIAHSINAPDLEAQALEGIGRSHIREGNPSQGKTHLQQALAIYQRMGAAEAQPGRNDPPYYR